jgi:hypothetical protein
MRDIIIDPFESVYAVADLERIIKHNQDELKYFTEQYKAGKMSRLVYAKFSKHYNSIIKGINRKIKKL